MTAILFWGYELNTIFVDNPKDIFWNSLSLSSSNKTVTKSQTTTWMVCPWAISRSLWHSLIASSWLLVSYENLHQINILLLKAILANQTIVVEKICLFSTDCFARSWIGSQSFVFGRWSIALVIFFICRVHVQTNQKTRDSFCFSMTTG